MAKQVMYFDTDGLCRQTTRNPAAELRRISELDTGDVPQGDLWNVLSTEWLTAWLKFAHPSKRGMHQQQPPGPISNQSLLQRGRIRAGLKLRKHFRLVNPATWSAFMELYGGGPAIEVAVGAGVQQGAPLEQHAAVKAADEGGGKTKLGRLSLFPVSTSASANDAADGADTSAAKAAGAASANGEDTESTNHIAAQMAPYSAGAKDAVRARPSLRGPVARDTTSNALTPSPASAPGPSPPRNFGAPTATYGIEMSAKSGTATAADETAQQQRQQQENAGMLHSQVRI